MSRCDALIVLASGLSTRFGGTNKLMAKLHGLPLAAYSAGLWRTRANTKRIAIVADEQPDLATLYADAGWQVEENNSPDAGQSLSLRMGVAAARAHDPRSITICLADMPLIINKHLDALHATLESCDAVMSESESVLMPPAVFSKAAFENLGNLQGDQGARSVFNSLANTKTCALTKGAARDVDTEAMLTQLHAEASKS